MMFLGAGAADASPARYPRVDGTGIQIEPEWTGKDEILTVTVACRRH